MKNYDDIINHERYRLKNHKPMSLIDRAVQFSPFAALTGFDEEIDETARITDHRAELTEDELNDLNQTFQMLLDKQEECPLVAVTYFQSDKRKSGGVYVTYTGNFRFFDEIEGVLKFVDGMVIAISEISRIKAIPHKGCLAAL